LRHGPSSKRNTFRRSATAEQKRADRTLRAILLNVLFKQANGEPLTAEDMQRLIDRADSDKLTKARERLEQASGSKAS
jgi:hypothetical protein